MPRVRPALLTERAAPAAERPVIGFGCRLGLHVLNAALAVVLLYSLFGQYGPGVTATRLR